MALPNTQQASKWKADFSNMPTISEYKDMRMYDYYVKSCVLPDYNTPFDFDHFMKFQYPRPVTRANEDLTQLQIEFVCSEDWDNYTKLLEWQAQLKYGQNATSEFIKDSTIKRINITLLDNEKRSKKIIYFTNAFLVSLSSLSLTSGDDTDIIFTTNFVYQEMLIEDSRT